MFKKFGTLLALSALFLGACGSGTASPEASSAAPASVAPATAAPADSPSAAADDGTKTVAFVTPTAASGFMAMVAGELQKGFEAAGYEWNIGIADGDPKKQIEQIENFTTLGVDTLVVMAVDPTALKDPLQKAKDAGIHVINFTTDPGVGDVYMGADEKAVGEAVASVASGWIDTAFADAADGSVKVAIMEFRDTHEAAARSDGLKTIASNPKVTVVKTISSPNDTAGAQAAAENLLLTNPDLNAILTYNSAMSLGVNAAALAPTSPVADKSKLGVFGSDISEEIASNIRASAQDESVLRGVTMLGGNIFDAFAKILTFSEDLIAGKPVPARDLAVIDKVDVSNIENYITQLYPSMPPAN